MSHSSWVWKKGFTVSFDRWPLTDDEEFLLTSLWSMSVLLMKSTYWFNGDCWMTWLWPVGMRGSWAFTMNWTEWHIYQVTVRLFLPSCCMNSPCECLWENSFRFRSPQKERVLTQKLFLSLKVSSLTILIACAMINFPPNFPILVDHLS